MFYNYMVAYNYMHTFFHLIAECESTCCHDDMYTLRVQALGKYMLL